MLIAVAEEEHLPEWLYPHRVPPFSGASLSAKYLDRGLSELRSALGVPVEAISDWVPTHCGTGYPHDALDQLPQLAPEFVTALAALPDDQRWRVAQAWAGAALGRRPNEAQLAEYKARLRELSAFAQQAIANGWLVVWA